MAHAQRILLSTMAILAFAGVGCAGSNSAMPVSNAPTAPIVASANASPNASGSDVGLPERDPMAQLPEQLSGKVRATEPDDRGGEGYLYTDSSCGIVPEDRDRR